MTNIIILGAGQIGQAVRALLEQLTAHRHSALTDYALNVEMWDQNGSAGAVDQVVDFSTANDLALRLRTAGAAYVINCLPFYLNERVAQAALSAAANYIDFTEDDLMAERVRAIYAGSSLSAAVKCGLAPGFINYLGVSLSKKIDQPENLLIAVGALPRHINWRESDPGSSYNLSWSVDGLVNEYIRPCQIRRDGVNVTARPLTGLEQIRIDGTHYEAAHTSGGVGSLVTDLQHIPNVAYKTIRYPGHYKYVAQTVTRADGDFEKIKKEFLQKFPFNRNDVIVVYAECAGRTAAGSLRREVFAEHYVGTGALSGIQSLTAGGGIAVLELMLAGKISGVVGHTDISLDDFMKTHAYKIAYNRR